MKKAHIVIITILSILYAFSGSAFSLTANVFIENAQVNGGEFSWEIHFTPVSGWTGGTLNANEYLKSASWYFSFNTGALTSPVITFENAAIISSHYTSTTGITGGTKVYVSTGDDGDSQQIVQGTKYHLYTVKMTITDPAQESDLIWNEVDTAVENFAGDVATATDITYNNGSGDIALPVLFSSFEYEPSANSILLKWTTQTETNCLGYHVMKSENETGPFEKINSQIIPGAGTSASPKYYEYTDETIEAGKDYYYLLKQVDTNGQTTDHGPLKAQNNQAVPDVFALQQNYPNPFNPTTNITYDLPNASFVSMVVYNLKGEQVDELVNGQKNAGKYNVVWNAAQFSSGTYFIHIQAGDFTAIKKCVLLK